MENFHLKRQKLIKERKNLPKVVLMLVILWGGEFGIIFALSPENTSSVLFFIVNTFATLLVTLSIVFQNTRRGFLVSLVLTVFLGLRIVGVGNLFNFLLLLAIAIIFELVTLKKNK